MLLPVFNSSEKYTKILLLTPTLSEPDVRKFCALVPANMLVNGQNVDSVKGKVNEFSENVETVQYILQQYLKDNSLEIVEMLCEAGSKDGDNYMSLIKRIKAKIRTKNSSGEFRIVKEVRIKKKSPRVVS